MLSMSLIIPPRYSKSSLYLLRFTILIIQIIIKSKLSKHLNNNIQHFKKQQK